MSAETEYLKLVQHAAGDEGWADDMNNNLAKVDAISQKFQSNFILNGDFQVAQQGTEFVTTPGNLLTVDRWRVNASGLHVKKMILDDGTSGLRVARNSSTVQFQSIYQKMEIPGYMSGRKATLSGKIQFNESSPSCYAYMNWMGGSSPITLGWANMGVDNTNTEDVQTFKKKLILPPDDTSSNLLLLQFLGNGSVGTTDYDFSLGDIKLEPGDVATPFCPRPYGQEMAMCQRYFNKLGPSSDVYTRFGLGSCTSTTSCDIMLYLPVNMRTVPTVTINGATALFSAGSIIPITGCGLSQASTGNQVVVNLYVSSGLAAGNAAEWVAYNDNSVSISLDTGY